MNTKKLLFSIVVTCFVLTSCKKEIKKTDVLAVNSQKVSLHISGMTCEIACAKTIQSKLAKKEGVLDAKVVFNDSIATINFDANKTSKAALIAFVDGIAGGELYKASESKKEAHTCTEAYKKECESKTNTSACKEDCKMDCCKDKKS